MSLTDIHAIIKLFEGIGQIVDSTKPAKSIKTVINGGEFWHHENNQAIMHREDGPAFITSWGKEFYYLFDKMYPRVDDWAVAVLKLHKKSHDIHAVRDFLRTVMSPKLKEAL